MAKITANALKHKYPNWKNIVISGENDVDNIVSWEVDGVESPPPSSEWPAIELEYSNYLKTIQYKEDRKNEYPDLGEQFDKIFHAIDADSDLKTKFSDFHTAIKAVKDKYPKPSE